MKDNGFDVESLLNDDSFVNWVLNNKDSFVWEEFVRTNPDRQEIIARASHIIRELHKAEKSGPNPADEGKVWSRITQTLEAEHTEVTPTRPSTRRSLGFKLATVAAFSILIGLGIWRFYPSKNRITYGELITHAEKATALQEHVNFGAEPMKIKLPDGSVVTLGRNSKLSYAKSFHQQKREVFMTGEAFFDVTKDSSRPFYVYANETVTRVLGTSFGITAFENGKKVTVNVKSGRVSVYRQSRIQTADPETNGLVLLPNQKVTFDRENESLVKNLVETPVPIKSIPAKSKERFDEVPLPVILAQLEESYGIKIIYDQELVSNCIISMVLDNGSLYDNLDVISKTIGGSYKEVDAQIVIESNGCI